MSTAPKPPGKPPIAPGKPPPGKPPPGKPPITPSKPPPGKPPITPGKPPGKPPSKPPGKPPIATPGKLELDEPKICEHPENKFNDKRDHNPTCPHDDTVDYRIRVFGPYNPEDEKCDTDLSIGYYNRVFTEIKNQNEVSNNTHKGSSGMYIRMLPLPSFMRVGLTRLVDSIINVNVSDLKEVARVKTHPEEGVSLLLRDKLKALNEHFIKLKESDNPSGKKSNPNNTTQSDKKVNPLNTTQSDKKAPTIGGTHIFFTKEDCSFF